MIRIQKKILLSCFLCLTTIGCGHAPTAVSGKVALQGKPIEEGAMRLFPQEGTPGDGAGAKIEGGSYSIAEVAGLAPGRYRVSIVGTRETGRKVRDSEGDPDAPAKIVKEVIQYVPQKYNMRTELEVTLEAGQNEKDFLLEPRK